MITLDQYSRKVRMDLETSMAAALRKMLESTELRSPMGVTQLTAVFDEWPSSEDNYTPPAACIVPTSDVEYADAYPTPTLIEGTWEPEGRPGLGLYAVAEAEQEMEVLVRAATPHERNMVVLGLEAMFFESPIGMRPAANRYGRVVTMDDYWGLPMRVSAARKRKLDGAEAAQQNQWEASFFLRAQAKQVVLGEVHPFVVTVRQSISQDPIP